MNETVSVIIPTYNCGRYVTEAVESVLSQTRRAAQIIVVDDGSTDDTAERMERYAGRGIEFIRQANQGVSAARNAGLAVAWGDFAAFLDSDDVWHPRKLEIQLAEMGRQPEFGMMGTATFDWPHEKPEGVMEEPGVKEIAWERLVVKNYFTTSSVMVRRAPLAEAGLFDTALQGPEDYDLWLRLAEITSVGNIGLRLTGYRATPCGLGNQALTMEAGMTLILRKLTQRRTWQARGNWILKRKALAYLRLSSALMFGAAGNQPASIRRILLSMAGYPWPFRREETKAAMLRPKRLAVALMRTFRLKNELPKPARPKQMAAASDVP